MKKTLLTALALLMLSAGAWADPINLKKAKELAAAYMHGNNLPEVVETAVTKRKSPTGTPPLYIFNRGEGKGFISYLEMIVCRQFWDTPNRGILPLRHCLRVCLNG